MTIDASEAYAQIFSNISTNVNSYAQTSMGQSHFVEVSQDAIAEDVETDDEKIPGKKALERLERSGDISIKGSGASAVREALAPVLANAPFLENLIKQAKDQSPGFSLVIRTEREPLPVEDDPDLEDGRPMGTIRIFMEETERFSDPRWILRLQKQLAARLMNALVGHKAKNRQFATNSVWLQIKMMTLDKLTASWLAMGNRVGQTPLVSAEEGSRFDALDMEGVENFFIAAHGAFHGAAPDQGDPRAAAAQAYVNIASRGLVLDPLMQRAYGEALADLSDISGHSPARMPTMLGALDAASSWDAPESTWDEPEQKMASLPALDSEALDSPEFEEAETVINRMLDYYFELRDQDLTQASFVETSFVRTSFAAELERAQELSKQDPALRSDMIAYDPKYQFAFIAPYVPFLLYVPPELQRWLWWRRKYWERLNRRYGEAETLPRDMRYKVQPIDPI